MNKTVFVVIGSDIDGLTIWKEVRMENTKST